MGLDGDWGAIARHPCEDLACVAAPENLAYVIYTSGSTGQPKGVATTHGAICNLLHWMQSTFGLDASDGVLQKTTFTFCVSVWEFFWPLITGVRLVLAAPKGHLDIDYLLDQIEKERLTTIHFVPSMLNMLLQSPRLERCRSLRRVLCGGEALSAELAQHFVDRLPWCPLFNMYGPTETTIDVASWRYEKIGERSPVLIGRPIANTALYVLDECGQPVPVGVPGELYVGGVQLARGYLGPFSAPL